MANTLVVDILPSGLGALSLELYAPGSTDLANPTTAAAAEDATRKGRYEWTVPEALDGLYEAIVKNAGGAKVGGGGVRLVDDAGPYYLAGLLESDLLSFISSKVSLISSSGSVMVLSGLDEDGMMGIVRGDQFVQDFTLEQAAPTHAWFTVKRRLEDDDADAVVQVTMAAGAVTVEGAAAEDPSAASIAVDGTTLTVTLGPTLTALLEPRSNTYYDVQVQYSADDYRTVSRGRGRIIADVTRSM